MSLRGRPGAWAMVPDRVMEALRPAHGVAQLAVFYAVAAGRSGTSAGVVPSLSPGLPTSGMPRTDAGYVSAVNTLLEQQIQGVPTKALPAPCPVCGRDTTFRLSGAPLCPRCGVTEPWAVVWTGPPLCPEAPITAF